MSCLLRAAGCCGYANGMLSLIYFGILGNTISHWVCAWESVWIAECLEPIDASRRRSSEESWDYHENNEALNGFWMPVFFYEFYLQKK